MADPLPILFSESMPALQIRLKIPPLNVLYDPRASIFERIFCPQNIGILRVCIAVSVLCPDKLFIFKAFFVLIFIALVGIRCTF